MLDYVRKRSTISPITDCWNWILYCDKYGRAKGTIKGRRGVNVARELMNNPPDLEVCRTCDNPSCVNPGHLFLGTHKDNMLDMKEKGRAGGNFKHSNKLVRQIKEDHTKFSMGNRKLAKKYGLPRSTILHYLRGSRRV